MTPARLFAGLKAYVDARRSEFGTIGDQRRQRLGEIAAFAASGLDSGRRANLVFICTHNSRRSHLCQIWAAVAAATEGVVGLHTFSGGTEATAFNPRAVAALERSGLDISADGDPANPRYSVRFADSAEPIIAFSKVYDRPPNPKAGFCAVMNCSSAADACPVVAGATTRVDLRYDDPKEADGSASESRVYNERSAQIAREMFYLASLLP